MNESGAGKLNLADEGKAPFPTSKSKTPTVFKTIDHLITIDAPDGSGKGEIAGILAQQLSDIYGTERVLLTSPNRFDQSPQALRIGTKLKEKPWLLPQSAHHNSHYMAALMLNYQNVILSALDLGKLVIIDSSEIRSLAYILDKGSIEAIESTIRWIKSGRATAGTLAGNRIVLCTGTEDCLANIRARGKQDYGDPINVAEATRRQHCYDSSVTLIKSLKQDNQTNWINVDNPRVKVSDINDHLIKLVGERIIPHLRF